MSDDHDTYDAACAQQQLEERHRRHDELAAHIERLIAHKRRVEVLRENAARIRRELEAAEAEAAAAEQDVTLAYNAGVISDVAALLERRA